MITLITGVPGTGKTAYVVSELLKTLDRPIYVDGIPDLVLDHQVAPPSAEWVTLKSDADGATSHQWNIPANSIVIVDEAQRSFRPRPAGSKVPDYVAALETHRHAGLDFWFITQHPNLIDANVRRLCGRHIHIRQHPLGRNIHEWSQVEDPESSAARANSVTRPYKLPKEVFGKYKSAEVHTKNARRIPFSLYVLAFIVLFGSVFGFYTYNKISTRHEAVDPQLPVSAVPSAPTISPGQTVASVDPADLLVAASPRVPGYPETAPLYDQLRKPVNMPIVVGCIATASRCSCTNQQGLDAGLDNLQCRIWIASPRFDPYTVKPEPQVVTADKEGGAASKSEPEKHQPQAPNNVVAMN